MAELQRAVAFPWMFRMFQSADPTAPATGFGSTGWTLEVSKDGGSFQSMSSPGSVTERGDGWYVFTVSASDLTADLVVLKAAHSAGITEYEKLILQTKIVSDLNDLSAAQVNSECDTALTDYDAATGAEVGALNDLSSSDVNTTVAALLPTNMTLLAIDSSGGVDVSSNNDKTGYQISGTLTKLDDLKNFDPATDLVKLATDAVTSAAIKDGAVTAAKLATGVLTDTKMASNFKTALADSIADEAYEGTYTLRQLLRLMSAALLGKITDAETTNPKFRDLGDSKNRIDAIVTADGNRTSLTYDAT